MRVIRHLIVSVFMALLAVSTATAQSLPGFIMVAGGGSEQQGGWSDEPYRWAVERSQNKRVACITFSTNPTSWLPGYFESLGAARARNFIINTEQLANDQATYDSIISYDVLFFKGGNQWNYYHTYKGSLLEDAVEHVFSNGGVLSGTSAGLHILSGVMFTAENGTVYSEEALKDPFNQYMTLEDDFIPGLPDAIFDSHVSERGRFGRLLGFLGNWNLLEGSDIPGIGVDDKTAFCIDTSMTAVAFGTGAVNLYRAGNDNVFSISGTKLLASDIIVTQLLDGCTLDLNDMAISGFSDHTEPLFTGEDFTGHMYMSATSSIDDNAAFFQALAGYASSGIVIITGYEPALAQATQAALQQAGSESEILSTTPDTYNDPGWLEKLQQASLYLFVDNELQVLKDFLEFGSNGQYIWSQMLDGAKRCAFMGSDSRHAGKISVVNFDREYASYDGELVFEEGLGLLKNTVVMPYVFSSEVDEENTATAVPYAMVLHKLAYGMWMHGDSYAEVSLSGNDIQMEFSGSCPVLFIENPGTAGGFASMPASSSGKPRNIAGMEKFRLRLVDHTTPITLQNVSGTADPDIEEISVYPNPAKERLYISGTERETVFVKIYELSGRLLGTERYDGVSGIWIGELEEGIYLISVVAISGKPIFTTRIIKTG